MQTSNHAVTHSVSSSSEDQKVEVFIEQQDAADVVTLRYSTWTEGLGWCAQKTIRLGGGEIDELHRALTVARHRINRRRADAGETIHSAQVIQLPTVA